MRRMAVAASLMLAGCGHEHPAANTPVAGGVRAVALLHDVAGRPVGRAIASDVMGGVRLTLDTTGLPPGRHGWHVHAIGACDAPGFASAGGRWWPTAAGRDQAPPLLVGANGRGSVGAVEAGATMAQLLDADGAAMLIERDADDPTGGASSGPAIACGVFAAG